MTLRMAALGLPLAFLLACRPAAFDDAEAEPDPIVWVNTKSGTYHCAGSQWYERTTEGVLMLESLARGQGNEAAGGELCGDGSVPPGVDSIPVETTLTADTGAEAGVRVWVNTESGTYHCPGTRYYKATRQGTLMTEDEALGQGHEPAGGRECP